MLATMFCLLAAWAEAAEDPKPCSTRLTVAADNSERFVDPPMGRKFSIGRTQAMFQELNSGRYEMRPPLVTYEYEVPRELMRRSGIQRVVALLKLFTAIPPEELTEEFSKRAVRKKTLDPVTDASLVLELGNPDTLLRWPVSLNNALLAEALFPRSGLQQVLRSAAAKIPGTRILEGIRISAWSSDQSETHLFVDVTGLSHAEFAVLLNELAAWMEARAKR